MHLRVDDRRIRYALFLLLALGINLIDSLLVRSIGNPQRRMAVAIGASFDVVAIVTAIYYWLLVRPGLRARWSLVPIALAGILRATYLYPNATSAREILAGLCEFALIAFVIIQVQVIRRRSTYGDGDPVDGIQGALEPIFVVPRAANLFAVEFSLLYYALFSWRAKPHVPSEAKAFSLHKRGGQPDLLFGLAIASVLEILPMHLVLNHWSPAWAWIGTGLSLYGAIWIMGLARSFELRPVLVGADYVDLRYGLLFRLRIPREMIRIVRRAKPGDATSATVVPRKDEPNLYIELVSSMQAEKLFGFRKGVSRIAVRADDPLAFERALADLMGK